MDHQTESEVRTILKGLSAKDFLQIGLNEVAYMRPLTNGVDQSYAIYAADGTRLGIMESRGVALKAMRDNDLLLVTLQ